MPQIIDNGSLKPWKTLSSQLAFDHRWFKVRQDEVELPNGKVLDDYFVWLKDDVSLVVPVTSDNMFVLTKQYKHGAGQIVIEFPAGYINKNESPEDAAARETAEETGYVSENMIFLTTLTNDATKEIAKVHLYLAKDAAKRHDTAFDDNEDIETLLLSPSEVLDLISKGEIWVSASVVAGLMACMKLGLLSHTEKTS